MLPLSLFAYDGTGCAGMQEEFLTSVAQIKKKLRLDMDSASVRPTVCVRGLALRAVALGRAWTLFGSRKNSKPACPGGLSRENCLGCAQNPQRPVHALLARS